MCQLRNIDLRPTWKQFSAAKLSLAKAPQQSLDTENQSQDKETVLGAYFL